MGIEGAGGYMEMPQRRNPEGNSESYQRALEGRSEQGDSWIAGIISPEELERMKQHSSYEGHSVEWIIMDALLYKKVECGPELDPVVRARLGNLIAAMRILMIPNLTPREQEFMRGLAQATTVDWSSIQTEVTPDTVADIRYVWGTFGLKVPGRTQMKGLLGDAGASMHSMFPKPQYPPK